MRVYKTYRFPEDHQTKFKTVRAGLIVMLGKPDRVLQNDESISWIWREQEIASYGRVLLTLWLKTTLAGSFNVTAGEGIDHEILRLWNQEKSPE